MLTEAIQKDLRQKVSERIELVPEGKNRYRVLTPFTLDDGDALSIVLRNEGAAWVLSDEGHTLMHLSYDVDLDDILRAGNRHTIVENALSFFGAEDRDGELVSAVDGEQYGDALYSFIQALLRVSDVQLLSRERVRSTFMEDFSAFISEVVSEDRRHFDWHDPAHDPEGIYVVDCRVNGTARPLFLFALPNDDRTRDATIALYRFEQWGISFRSLAIFENQEDINRKVLARLTDVCDRQFSSLYTNRKKIEEYIIAEVA